MGWRKTNNFTYALRIPHYASRFAPYASLGGILCVPLILLTCASSPLVVPEYGLIAPDFTLKDQNDIEIQLSKFRGENVLLFGFDKDSVDRGGAWLNLLVERYNERLQILPIANGASLPLSARLFLRGKMKAEFQDAAEEFNLSSFLLDWKGEVSRQYGIPLETPTVALIGPTGRIHLVHPLPPLTADEARATFDRIDKQIK